MPQAAMITTSGFRKKALSKSNNIFISIMPMKIGLIAVGKGEDELINHTISQCARKLAGHI